jgi:hypothetical protein
LIASNFLDVRQGNQRRQKLVQQIMNQYTARQQSNQGQNPNQLGGVRSGGSMGGGGMGGGMLNRFAKRNAGPNVTNPMQMGISKALQNALGPGGHGIPGAYESSHNFGEAVDGPPQPNFNPYDSFAQGIPGRDPNSPGAAAPPPDMGGAPSAPAPSFAGFGGAPPGVASNAPTMPGSTVVNTAPYGDVDPGFHMIPGGMQNLPGGFTYDPLSGKIIPASMLEGYGQGIRGLPGRAYAQ